MRSGRYLLCAAAFLAMIAFHVPGSHGQTPLTIPSTEATALSGQTIRLPRDLPPFAFLVLGFSEKSSSDSAECGRRLEEALPKQVDAKVYQLPVLEGAPKLVRGFVTRSMKKSVPNELQSTFVPVFDHEAEWKRLTGFESPDDAYILLTERQGRVLWRTHGPCGGDRVRMAIAQLEREARPVHAAQQSP